MERKYHPYIYQLSAQIGVPVADRAIDNTYFFDGRTIGTFWSRYSWDEKKGDYTNTGRVSYFLDHDILHELVHWMVATPEQRDLPEFGLGTPHLPGSQMSFAENVLDSWMREKGSGPIRFPQGDEQEIVTQLVCCFLGSKHGISSQLSGETEDWAPGKSWVSYLEYKNEEDKIFARPEIVLRALQVIREFSL